MKTIKKEKIGVKTKKTVQSRKVFCKQLERTITKIAKNHQTTKFGCQNQQSCEIAGGVLVNDLSEK